MSEADIREAEAELGIAFPDQYREYLLRQSAGGVVNRLSRSGAGWGWHGDSSTNYDLLTTAFPHPDSYRVHEDDLDARGPPVQLSVASISRCGRGAVNEQQARHCVKAHLTHRNRAPRIRDKQLLNARRTPQPAKRFQPTSRR
ncbi:SMI1/KNR4 family protein [Streptomyces olivoreticuli]